VQLLHLPQESFLACRGEAGKLPLFCRHCGVRAFGVGNETPIGKMYGVNVGCLEGISEEELSKIPITYVDGMNDRWQHAPEFFSHL
jgi:hypothetical protein